MKQDPSDSVPADFPVAESLVALAGFQPKLGLVETDGRYTLPNAASRQEQHRACEDAANLMARSVAGRGDASDEQLVHLLKVLRRERRFSERQNVWVVRRVAELLDIKLPPLPSPSDEYTIEVTEEYLAELRSKQDLSPLEKTILEVDQEHRLKLENQNLGLGAY